MNIVIILQTLQLLTQLYHSLLQT